MTRVGQWFHHWALARRGPAARESPRPKTNQGEEAATRKSASARRKRHHGWRTAGIVLLVLIVLVVVGRVVLPWAVRDYVNRTLDRNPLYSGRIGPVHVHIWRGAYSIEDIRLNKTTGNVPVPLFAAKRVDFSIQWNALIHRRVVGRVLIQQPEINFVDSPNAGESQTGSGGPWLQMLQDLFPFKINRAVLQDGSVHFRTYQSQKPVDIYLSNLDLTVDNLGNIRNETTPLISTVQATALAMGEAKLQFMMTFDPFSYRPTFHLALRLLGLDVTKINDFALTYGNFDFKRGWFDLVVEADAKEGQITGYVKPLFRDLKVFSLRQDIKEDTALQFFWQALVGAATTLFKNQPRNQFGTLVPFAADASGATSTDILATVGNLLRNAFIRAYLPRLQSGQEGFDGLQFEPPEVSAPVSPSETSTQ